MGIFLFFFGTFYGFRLNGFKRPVRQPVSRSVEPRGRRSVSQSVGQSVRESVHEHAGQSVSRAGGPCAERHAVSQSVSRMRGRIEDI